MGSVTGAVGPAELDIVGGRASLSQAAAALFLWSVTTWSFNPPVQARLLALAPRGGGLVLSLNASAIYLGIGLSGVLGGVVIDMVGVLELPLVAAVLGVVALALLGQSVRRSRKGEAAPATA